MRSVALDLRDALRSFRQDRAYSFTVILTLALTIGATTAVFSIVNGVLLAPLAHDESDRLVALRERWREAGNTPFPSTTVTPTTGASTPQRLTRCRGTSSAPRM
jgi:hypothetical protein